MGKYLHQNRNPVLKPKKRIRILIFFEKKKWKKRGKPRINIKYLTKKKDLNKFCSVSSFG